MDGKLRIMNALNALVAIALGYANFRKIYNAELRVVLTCNGRFPEKSTNG